eukprot:g14430.t1
MQPLRTAILEHRTADGVHYDWLIEDPRLPNPKATDARLWTARVTPPPQDWPRLRRFALTVIPPHRRVYLDYQGPVSGDRGEVRRLASGVCEVSLWSEVRIVMQLRTEVMRVELSLKQQAGKHWVTECFDSQEKRVAAAGPRPGDEPSQTLHNDTHFK